MDHENVLVEFVKYLIVFVIWDGLIAGVGASDVCTKAKHLVSVEQGEYL